MVRSRAIIGGASVVLLGAASVLACTAGDEIQYDTAGLSTDGGIPEGAIVDEAGRIIFESGVPVQERPEAAPLPPPDPKPCGTGIMGPDGGDCDTSAGLGCCLDTTLAVAQCEEQVQFAAGAFCAASGSLFVACTSSSDDSVCCLLKDGPTGTFNTRYRGSCDGGVEVCDPSNGGVCTNGAGCVPPPTPCSKATLSIGTCGPTPTGFSCP